MSNASEDILDQAAEVFIKAAIDAAPEDEGNLKDSIGVLKEINSYDIKQIKVGVDMDHTPATRVKPGGTVGQYAGPMETMFGYIDHATMETEAWLNGAVRQRTAQEAKRAGFASTIAGAVSNVFGSLGRMFGGLFGR